VILMDEGYRFLQWMSMYKFAEIQGVDGCTALARIYYSDICEPLMSKISLRQVVRHCP
jgi:hypothetical protein